MRFKKTSQTIEKKLSETLNEEVKISPQKVEEALNMINRSDEASEIVCLYANYIVKQIGLKSSAARGEPSCKKIMRILFKAVANYNGDVSKVPDIGRMRILIEKPEDIIALRKMFLGNNPIYKDERLGDLIDAHPTNNITINEFEDYYLVPSSTGRIAIHIGLYIKIPGKEKIPFEIQVVHKDMLTTEEFTRDNFMNAQRIRRKNRPLTQNEKDMVENYDASSRKRYTADAIKYNLIEPLRRQDLVNVHRARQRAAQAREFQIVS